MAALNPNLTHGHSDRTTGVAVLESCTCSDGWTWDELLGMAIRAQPAQPTKKARAGLGFSTYNPFWPAPRTGKNGLARTIRFLFYLCLKKIIFLDGVDGPTRHFYSPSPIFCAFFVISVPIRQPAAGQVDMLQPIFLQANRPTPFFLQPGPLCHP